MLAYSLRRLLYALITFLGITFLVFVLVHLVPGDPVHAIIGPAATGRVVPPEIIKAIRAEYRLDDPILVQYADWVRRVVTLDFGRSLVDRRPVREKIASKLLPTLELNVLSLLAALVVALPVGLLSGARPGTLLDRSSGSAAFALYSLPNFWVALMLMELFAVRLELLPLYGMASVDAGDAAPAARVFDHLLHLVLPVTTLAYVQIAIFIRFARTSVVELIDRPFILAARARGVGEGRLLTRHLGRNALVPMITLLGLMVPYLLSGSVIVEKIFQWDGIGRLYFDAILTRDYPTIMGLTVMTAIVTLAAALLTDLLYAVADPRIRVGARE